MSGRSRGAFVTVRSAGTPTIRKWVGARTYERSVGLLSLAGENSLMYPELMLEEKDFQRKADAAFEDLKKRLLVLGDQHGFDVEGESGKLEVIFEEPEEAKFVISPNTPVREIWISALSTSFKLGWNDSRNAFVHEKSREDLHAVMSRVVSQQLGTPVKL
jgi:iron donor protein CyaY